MKDIEYIELYNNFHNYKYDYSSANFKNVKIKIICPEHGEFEQNRYSHKKYGCWKCSVELRAKNQISNKDKFTEKADLVHGINAYDYSSVVYIDSKTKVKIICHQHGEFEQIPNSHLSGNGCPKCGDILVGLKCKHTTEIFREKGDKVHDFRYDYTKVDYVNNNTPVIIICKEHGEFKQLPNNHLAGQNCSKCSDRYTMSEEEFKDKCSLLNNNLYDYSSVKYVNSSSMVEIICKEHGSFIQKASNHVNLKQGCPKCYGLNKTTEDFIKESNLVHGDDFVYTKTQYKSAKEHVIIICKKHGEFKQTPSHHLSGQGCPICKSSKGERKVRDYLTDRGILFEHHYKFEDLYNHEFDFYIPSLNLCIEYDGVQHFKPNNYFGGIVEFEKRIIKDKEKKRIL